MNSASTRHSPLKPLPDAIPLKPRFSFSNILGLIFAAGARYRKRDASPLMDPSFAALRFTITRPTTIRPRHGTYIAVLTSLLLLGSTHGETGGSIANQNYRITANPDGSVSVKVAGMREQIFNPEFTIVWSLEDPGIHRNQDHHNTPIGPRRLVRWLNVTEPAAAVNAWLATPEMRDATQLEGRVIDDASGVRRWEYRDASGDRVRLLEGQQALGTSRPFHAGSSIVVRATRVSLTGRSLHWEFEPQALFRIAAQLELPEGGEDPVLTFELTPERAAYFSVAFTGAPDAPVSAAMAVPQECAGEAQRHFDFVMSEADLKLPRVAVPMPGGQIALVADPGECRYRLPTLADSRFGLMLGNFQGRLRPVLLAPLLGGAESLMQPGNSWRFALRLVVRGGDWQDTYSHIAQNIFDFRNRRDASGPGSLNDCLYRIIDYLADHNRKNYALWHDEQKYYDYFTDQLGVFKPFSPMPGLSAAVVTDDEDFFRRRARPAVEFALSRKSNVFGPYEGSNPRQITTHRGVGDPYVGYAQLIGVYDFFQRRVPVLRALAEARGPSSGSIADAVAAWKLTGDRQKLSMGIERALTLQEKQQIEPTLFGQQSIFDLCDLYLATNDPRILRGALTSAYHYATTLNLYPTPPEGTILADPSGYAPIHNHSFGRHKSWGFDIPQPVPAPPQMVPAWRVSRLGLRSIAYPIEYWQNAHGTLLRLATLGGDDFLRDIAHVGMIGRFGNYPGDNRSKVSLVGETPDAVEAQPWRWTFATVNPGHAWDFLGAILDFIVSDAFARTKGRIDFPAESVAGSGFRTRAYGAQPGRFYTDNGVRLWLPRGLVDCNNGQLDWVAGYREGQFYIALWSQSFKQEHVTVRLSHDWVDCSDGAVRRWVQNSPVDDGQIVDNELSFDIPAKGVVAFAVPATVKPRLQEKLFSADTPPLPADSYATAEAPFGRIHAMLLTAGRGLTSAFVYTEAQPDDVIAATIHWRQDGGPWNEARDEIYPYEFSPELVDGGGSFEFVIDVENSHRQIQRSQLITLAATRKAKATVAANPPATKLWTPIAPSKFTGTDGSTEFLPSDDFVAYLKHAANPQQLGKHPDGRFFPYSTPQGRRIAWRQPVWEAALFAEGCTPTEAERELRLAISRGAEAVRLALAARSPKVDFSVLTLEQREILVDFALTESVAHIREDVFTAVISSDWKRFFGDHLYVRYASPAPDHDRNRAFAQRWATSLRRG